MNDYALSYADAARLGPSAAGGKGWNLGRLAGFGFPVPRGGVLAADAYRLATTNADVDALATRELPGAVRDAVAEILRREGLEATPVAVRSSATVEDGAETSFAGVHESVLSVTGLDDVCRAVARCYASLWTPHAVAYRRRFGVDDDEVACAVVLCEMVGGPGGAPEAAGVAFSCDPRSGRRDTISVEAVRGLGDALVSGTVEPERLVVRDGSIFESVASVERNGTANVLSDERALELGRLVRRVEWALGDGQEPQDVEWAHDGERFVLLQARPVTRVPRATFAEVASMPVVWSNANLKEVVPGVQTTLSWDNLRTVLRACLFKTMLVGDFELPEGLEVVRRIRGRAYFDSTTLVWFSFDLFGTTPREFNESMGGRQPEIPLPGADRPLEGAAGKRRKRARLALLKKVWRFRKVHPVRVAETLAAVRRERARDLTALSDAELLGAGRAIAAATLPYSLDFQLATTSFMLWSTALMSLLEWSRPGAGARVASGLMAGSGGVVSAEHGYRLFDVVRAAAADPAARAILEAPSLDAGAWERLPDGSPFKAAFAAYLDEFGHRAVNETELSRPRWREDPTYPLERVRDLLADGRTSPPVAAARATRETAEAALARIAFPVRALVRFLARLAREGAAMRESGKSTLVACVEPIRAVALEAGARMAAAGVVERRDDVFSLSLSDVESYLLGAWDGAGARALVAARRARREAWLDEPADDVYVLDAEGRPTELPASAVPAPEAPAVAADGGLVGVGAAAGRATGIARVVMRPEDGARLGQGEILVAPSTEPAWTPLFLRAAAVVTEVGGYLSHGAIVAREYGLPAVVNVHGLIERIPDGATVRVDGDAGRVEVILE